MSDCGIYQIRNLVNGNVYVGQSVNLNRRKGHHFSRLKYGSHSSSHLQNAYNKYGCDNFVFEVLAYCEPHELTGYEQFFVDEINPSYNQKKECVNSPIGTKHSEETKAKIGLAHKGRPATEERKRNISLALTGRKLSPEHRAKCGTGRKGKKMSEETKRKISIANTGRQFGEEFRKKCSAARIGIKYSVETLKKMSDAHKGKNGHWAGKKRPETGKKISLALTGKKQTPEHIANAVLAKLRKKLLVET